PAPPAPEPSKRRALDKALSAAKDRGWSVWIFQPSSGSGPGGEGHTITDPAIYPDGEYSVEVIARKP
ncbi:MAG: hypothetical protein QGF09_09930, partial [Rhodospirillales bacterium]|nr:hypothetical protein [Rhodospirillales bacterium]